MFSPKKELFNKAKSVKYFRKTTFLCLGDPKINIRDLKNSKSIFLYDDYVE